MSVNKYSPERWINDSIENWKEKWIKISEKERKLIEVWFELGIWYSEYIVNIAINKSDLEIQEMIDNIWT